MKLLKAKGRDSPQQIVYDEENSRQKAYNLYIDVVTDSPTTQTKHVTSSTMKEEEFFQKPKIEGRPNPHRRIQDSDPSAKMPEETLAKRKHGNQEAAKHQPTRALTLTVESSLLTQEPRFTWSPNVTLRREKRKRSESEVNQFTCKPPTELSKALTKSTYTSKTSMTKRSLHHRERLPCIDIIRSNLYRKRLWLHMEKRLVPISAKRWRQKGLLPSTSKRPDDSSSHECRRRLRQSSRRIKGRRRKSKGTDRRGIPPRHPTKQKRSKGPAALEATLAAPARLEATLA